jgi:hypothetical protein
MHPTLNQRPPLRMLVKGAAMVPDYDALVPEDASRPGLRRFVGRKFDASVGPTFDVVDPTTGEKTGERRNRGAFVPQLGEDAVFEYPWEGRHRNEYLRHLRDGDLWAADSYTASVSGAKFDPKFGDEHAESAKSELEKTLVELRKLADKAESAPKPDPNAERAARLAASAKTAPAAKGA